MIKRLFRMKLRFWVEEYIGASHPDFEEAFEWVYKAPVWRWKIRIHCMMKFFYKEKFSGSSEKDPSWITKAEDLYRFLSK